MTLIIAALCIVPHPKKAPDQHIWFLGQIYDLNTTATRSALTYERIREVISTDVYWEAADKFAYAVEYEPPKFRSKTRNLVAGYQESLLITALMYSCFYGLAQKQLRTL